MIHKASLLGLSLCLYTLAVGPADAQERHGRRLAEPYISAGISLGFSGDIELETEAARVGDAQVSASGSADADPQVSVGGALTYMRPLHEHFALGGRFSLLTWRSDSEADTARNLAFDLAVVPQLRLPVSRTVELYLSVPIGLTLDLLNEVSVSGGATVFGLMFDGSIEADPGFGWNVAALLGARFAVDEDFGLFLELGYALHAFSHDIELRAGAGAIQARAETTIDIMLGQLALNVGLYF